MIAVAGMDMAVWDALAKAAGVPLCVLLGGSVGAVPAYNSNGLWLKAPAEVANEALAVVCGHSQQATLATRWRHQPLREIVC